MLDVIKDIRLIGQFRSTHFFPLQKVAQLVLHFADLRAAGDGGDGVLHGGDGAARLSPQRQLLRRPRTQPREPPPLPAGDPGSGEEQVTGWSIRILPMDIDYSVHYCIFFSSSTVLRRHALLHRRH